MARAPMPPALQRLHSWTQHGHYLPHQQASPVLQPGHAQHTWPQQAQGRHERGAMQFQQPAQVRHDRAPLHFQQPPVVAHSQYQQGQAQARQPVTVRQGQMGHQVMHLVRQHNSAAALARQQHLVPGTPILQAQPTQMARPAQPLDRQQAPQGQYMNAGPFQDRQQISMGYPVQHFQPVHVRPNAGPLYRQNA